MANRWGRKMLKRTLSMSKVRILYARATLTRYTSFYFLLAIMTCIALSSLQAFTFVENNRAVSILSDIMGHSHDDGLAILVNNKLQVCNGIPGQGRTNCTDIVYLGLTQNTSAIRPRDHDDFNGQITHMQQDIMTELPPNTPDTCAPALRWVENLLHDAEREDVSTLVFQVWQLALAIVTVLNESIPHLVAAILGHLLGAAWVAYRVFSTMEMTNQYRKGIIPRACGGVDVLGSWWDVRLKHAIIVLIVHGATLLLFLYLSAKLYKMYTSQSFSRVGASPEVHRMYMIVLVFSVTLQLSGYFTIASSVLWISKLSHGSLRELANHSDLYLAAFIVTLVMQFPWLYFGWVCARKECKIRFSIFCGISLALATISTLLFFSDMYRYIFLSWPFFSTVTVTSYILIVVATILGIVCRFNFNKGVAHFLQVTEALDGVDFTPVYFSNDDKERGNFDKEKEKDKAIDIVTDLPTISYVNLPIAQGRFNNGRGESVYSERSSSPIHLVSSPPLVSELGPRPPPRRSSLSDRHSRRLSKTPPKKTTRSKSASRISKATIGSPSSLDQGSISDGEVKPSSPPLRSAPPGSINFSFSRTTLPPPSPPPSIPIPQAPVQTGRPTVLRIQTQSTPTVPASFVGSSPAESPDSDHMPPPLSAVGGASPALGQTNKKKKRQTMVPKAHSPASPPGLSASPSSDAASMKGSLKGSPKRTAASLPRQPNPTAF